MSAVEHVSEVSKQMSEQCERTRGQANGPVLRVYSLTIRLTVQSTLPPLNNNNTSIALSLLEILLPVSHPGAYTR